MADIQWVRPPKQERSQKTLDRLLDAVEALFVEGTIDTLSVADIAKRAGHSVGAFYSRFPTKEAAVRAVHERFSEKAKLTADEVLKPARCKEVSMREIVPRVVGFLARDYQERRGLRRAVLLLNGTDPEIRARSKEVSGHVAGRIHGLLADHADELEHPDLLIASEGVHRILFAGALGALRRGRVDGPASAPRGLRRGAGGRPARVPRGEAETRSRTRMKVHRGLA